MIHIEFAELPERWCGAVIGHFKVTHRTMQRLWVGAYSRARASQVSMRSILVEELKAAEERLQLETSSKKPCVPPALFTYQMSRPGQKSTPRHVITVGGFIHSDRFREGMTGVKSATRNYMAEAFPGATDYIGASTFEEFKAEFLVRVQGFILGVASVEKALLLPDNFTDRILTPQFLIRLARRLDQPNQKTFEQLMLKQFLLASWEPMGLHRLDRFQLAEKVNAALVANYKPDAVWKAAYRLGLLSSRTPGPRGFEV